MEARVLRAALLAAVACSLGASHRTPNFVVQAPSDDVARQVGQAAEEYRRQLALEWIGQSLPNWSQPCPITVNEGPHLGAGGATSFVFDRGEVFGWTMTIQGPLDRILDSVLPHEITHTIFASHFRRPLPRWADEGACTTVEHASERHKQQKMLVTFLKTGRGIPFSQMFAMKEYPRDVLPLYAQGHSLAEFLIQQGGKRKFLDFVGDGLRQERWTEITHQHYGFRDLAELQHSWLAWVRQGSPPLEVAAAPAQPTPAASPPPDAVAAVTATPDVYRGRGDQPTIAPSDRLVPVHRDPQPSSPGESTLARVEQSPPDPAGGWTTAAGQGQPAVAPPRGMLLEWSRPELADAPGPEIASSAGVTSSPPGAKHSVYEAVLPAQRFIR